MFRVPFGTAWALLPAPLLLAGCLASQPGRPTQQPEPPPRQTARPAADRPAPAGQPATPPVAASVAEADPSAGARGVAGPPRFELPDMVVLGLAKQPRDLPLRSLAQRGSRTQATPRPRPTPADLQPTEVQTAGYFGPNSQYIQVPQAQWADCTYGSSERIYFWHRVRPDLPPAVLAQLRENRPDLADVALSQCPPTLGEAMQLALAGAVDARLERARQAERAGEARSQAAQDDRQVARGRWKDGATVRPAAQVADLRRRVESVLRQIEATTPVLNERPASRNTPPAEALKTRFTREVHPPLQDLARSAWAEGQSLPAGEAGRPAFDAWDRGAAGSVMSIVGRLQRLWPDGWWSLDLLGAFEADLSRLYQAQLADKPVLDAKARQQLAQALSQRRAASTRAEMPQALAEAPSGPKRVLFLTPGEMAAHQIGKDIGRGMKDALQARAKAQQAVEDLDRNLRQSRSAFWACWQRRCPEMPDLYLEYSRWLKEKDWYQLTRYSLEAVVEMYSTPRDPGMSQMLGAFMGLRTIDRGPSPSCQQAFDRWIAPVGTFVQTTLRRNPFDMAGIQAFSERLLGAPEHGAYQSCRDAMEFVYRPRATGG